MNANQNIESDIEYLSELGRGDITRDPTLYAITDITAKRLWGSLIALYPDLLEGFDGISILFPEDLLRSYPNTCKVPIALAALKGLLSMN